MMVMSISAAISFKVLTFGLASDCCHFVLTFLTIVRSSSGTGGGTGPPDILFTAPKRGGQTSKQVPHFMHAS
jgi:hypothetical protein